MRVRLHGIKVQRRTDRQIEAEAHVLRKTLGLEPDEPANIGWRLFEMLETFGVSTRSRGLVQLDWDVQTLKGPNATTAFTEERFKIVLSHPTYDKLERGNGTARVTFCHELGHAALHGDELIELTQIPHFEATLMRLTERYPTIEDSEWQANTFAAAFLLPTVAVAKFVNQPAGVVHLARDYGVQLDFAARRFFKVARMLKRKEGK